MFSRLSLVAVLSVGLSFPLWGCSGLDADAGPETQLPVPERDTTAITVPEESWTWVGFEDAYCGNGSTTGLGVNRTARSQDLLIYLEGGGACWDALTCLSLGTAANVRSGYGEGDFAKATFRTASAVDRSRASNPFKDMSYVYVPYCTGDVHAGDVVQTYAENAPPVHHKGAWNVASYLARLAPTFPEAKRIFLSGSSAGAYGAQINYERVRQAFPNAEVHVLADCGQTVNPAGSRLSAWRDAWNFAVPDGCEGCATDFTRLPGYLAGTYPDRRFALLAYTQDSVLRQFFGYPAPEFETQTLALLGSAYAGRENAKYFALRSAGHVMLDDLASLAGPGGVSLESWVSGFVVGAQDWTSVSE